ncbi:MAG: TIR domain-containing protein [Chitinophagaceae bacterium]
MAVNPPVQQDGYNLFISYSTDPDYNLSRRIEIFLEGFHRLKMPADIHLKQLQVCRDNSDFSLQKIRRAAPGENDQEDHVLEVLANYLQKSDYLLILCSRNAVNSRYIHYELNWFIKNKGVDKILVAVTEGADVTLEPALYFPAPLLENNLQTRIFYDLRASKKESAQWPKVRELNEELTKLAAHLNDESPGRILPAWHKEETSKLKRQRYISGIASLVFLLLGLLAVVQWQRAVRSEEEAIANKDEAKKNEKQAIRNLQDYKREQFQRNMRNGLVYFNAQEYGFAKSEFIQAKEIVIEFPTDSLLQSQRKDIESMLQQCANR